MTPKSSRQPDWIPVGACASGNSGEEVKARVDGGTFAVAVVAAYTPAPGARGGGRLGVRCGRDARALPARTARRRDRAGCGLPARRRGHPDWMGLLAGGGHVAGPRPGLRLLPCSAGL